MNQRGQSIVELSLLTPLLLVALMIPADFGMAFFAANTTQQATRDIARTGAAADTAYNATTLQAALLARLPNYSPTASIVRYTTGAAGCTSYVEATATITYPYLFYRMAGWVGANVPASRTITRTTRMRNVSQPSTNGGAPCTA